MLAPSTRKFWRTDWIATNRTSERRAAWTNSHNTARPGARMELCPPATCVRKAGDKVETDDTEVLTGAASADIGTLGSFPVSGAVVERLVHVGDEALGRVDEAGLVDSVEDSVRSITRGRRSRAPASAFQVGQPSSSEAASALKL